MSYFLGIINVGFVKKMILFVLIVAVFLQSKAMAMGKMDFLGELSGGGRDELVKWAGYGEDKLSTVVIGGKLLCHGGDGANPVSGASMAVVCGSNGKKKKVPWAGRGSTDSYGEFSIDVPSNLHAIPNLEKICHVNVVRIPSSSPCTRNHNKRPIKLDSIGEGIRTYTTHSIHLNIPHSHV